MKDNWWKIGVLAVVILGLVYWRQQGAQPEQAIELNEEQQLEERVNRFLEETGRVLPEGAERANLTDEVGEGAGTGVATRVADERGTTITILAGLPDPRGGFYQAFLVLGDNEYRSIGRLEAGKGGYMIERRLSNVPEEANEIVVSHEQSLTERPRGDIVLRGTFR
jgi:hypothetical protein